MCKKKSIVENHNIFAPIYSLLDTCNVKLITSGGKKIKTHKKKGNLKKKYFFCDLLNQNKF